MSSSSVSLGPGQSDVCDSIIESGDALPGKTEWEDALIKHNIIQAQIQQISIEEEQQKKQEEQEEKILREYRARRLHELQSSASRPRFGELTEIRANEFVVEVTSPSSHPSTSVVVLLHSVEQSSICSIVRHQLESLAKQFPHTKFVSILSSDAIPNYPVTATPTILIYQQQQIQHTIVGTAELGGKHINKPAIQQTLEKYQAIEPSQQTAQQQLRSSSLGTNTSKSTRIQKHSRIVDSDDSNSDRDDDDDDD